LNRLKPFIFLLVLSLYGTAYSQGNQQVFGQNRLSTKSGNYKAITDGKIEIIYNDSSDLLAKKALQLASEELDKLESILKYKIGNKVKVLLFNSLHNLQHSYASLEDPAYNNNLLYKLPKEFESVYYTGEDAFLRQQINKSLCKLMLKEMLYGLSLSEKVQRLRGQEIPEWFYQGLPAFMANNWDSELEAQLREGFRKGDFNNTNTLSPSQSELLGHSVWRYLVMEYGSETLSTLLFITRYSSRLDDAIYFHTKKRTSQVLKDWRLYMKRQFEDENSMRLPKGKANISPNIEKKNHASFALNQDGNKAAITTYDKGKFSVWLFDIKNQQSTKIFEGGLRVNNQIPNPDFPVVKWKSDKLLALLTEKNGHFVLNEINDEGKKTNERILTDFLLVKDFIYTKENNLFILAGRQPEVQLFESTNDNWVQRTSDSSYKYSLISYQNNVSYLTKKDTRSYWTKYKNEKTNHALISTYGDVKSPIIYPNNSLGFLWNKSGLYNAFHYVAPDSHETLTNYKTGIIDQQTENNILAEMIVYKGSHAIYTSEIDAEPSAVQFKANSCAWLLQNIKIDSTLNKRNTAYNQLVEVSTLGDSSNKNTDQFYLHGFDTSYRMKISPSGSNINSQKTSRNIPFLNRFNYRYVALQLDNSALGNYLYSFPLVPANELRNNLVSIHAHTVLSDILNKTKLAAGIRLNTLLSNTDYWFKFSYHKHRLGHRFNFDRRSRKYENTTNVITQNLSAHGSYILDYSFDPRLRTEFALGARNELIINKLSTESTKSLSSLSKQYAVFGPSLIIDNTVAKYPNYNQGIKLRLDAKNLWNTEDKISFVQLDFRSYQWLGRKVQIANRVSAAYNLGNKNVLFLVGGMENVIGRKDVTTQFPGISSNDYAFQSITGNLRGFITGNRYGSSFFVSNTEIRLPFHMYVYKSYAYSTFLRELQIIGFWDFGTAFTGNKPSSPGNPYNTIYRSTPNYTLSVTSKRNPYLNGIGFGLKSKFMGYDIRFDYAIGHQFSEWNKPISYFTLANSF